MSFLLSATLFAALTVWSNSAYAAEDYAARAYNILAPGQSGALNVDVSSTDQAKIYDSLTPLLGDVSQIDLNKYFKPASFGLGGLAVGRVEDLGRSDVQVVRDSFNVPHINAQNRSAAMFAAGWVGAEDRYLLIENIRNAARLAALDAPGLDPFDLAVSGTDFYPSKQTEKFIDQQRKLIENSGPQGKQVIKDVKDYAAGINAYFKSTGRFNEPWTVNDSIASTALVAAVVGKGGGGEVRSARLLAALKKKLGAKIGKQVWRDLRSQQDAEAPTTIPTPFNYLPVPKGATPGAVEIDDDSLSENIVSTEAKQARAAQRTMSNALVVGASRSATGRPMAVFGPQASYFYPSVLTEMDIHGGGIDARGAAFFGVSMYVLMGRGPDYAWSATSSTADIADQFLERLCEPDGSKPTRKSKHYLYKGKCRPMKRFNAGDLQTATGKQPLIFYETVHGPVQGTSTVKGKPYAVTLQRSSRGREAFSGVALSKLNEGKAATAKDFIGIMKDVPLSFNWFYVNNTDAAYYSSGRLPKRAKGTDPSLPTLGTGKYEWRGFLPESQHPQAINPPSGLLVNWNNKPAPGFGANDSNWSYGPVQRVQLFKDFKEKSTLEDVVAVMNKAATQDLRAVEVWPIVRRALGDSAPNPRAKQAVDLVDAWVASGASRIDRDLNGRIDDPGAAVLDVAWPGIGNAVLEPTLGKKVIKQFLKLQKRDNKPNNEGSAYENGWYSYVSKDLRTLLKEPVKSPYNRRYCGKGSLEACRKALWAAIDKAAGTLASSQGANLALWTVSANAERIKFQPGLIGDTMRWTNRPTFQQVIEFSGHR